MMLSVTQTSVKEKVEVFQQVVELPYFSSFVQHMLTKSFHAFSCREGTHFHRSLDFMSLDFFLGST
jgi:hypothetical protein